MDAETLHTAPLDVPDLAPEARKMVMMVELWEMLTKRQPDQLGGIWLLSLYHIIGYVCFFSVLVPGCCVSTTKSLIC